MAIRTTTAKVIALLRDSTLLTAGGDYDGTTDIAQHIDLVTQLVTRVST